MRGFSKAAALMLAHTACVNSIPVAEILSSVESIPTAYVTLRAPLQEDGTHLLALRLDLQESDQPCGLAKLKINGQSIPQNATGGGTGSFTILDGSIITASWNIVCHHDEKQFMEMNIHSVNGRALAHTSFSTSFYQTAPVVIKNIYNVVKVKYVHLKTTETQHVFDKEDAKLISAESGKSLSDDDFDLDAQVSALQDLRGEERELKKLIMDKENAIMDHLITSDQRGDNDVDDDSELPIPLRKCNDLACAFKSLAYEIRHAHGYLCEDARGWREFFGCAHGKEVSVDDAETYEVSDDLDAVDDEWYIEDFILDDDYDEELDSNGYIAEHYRSSPHIPLIMLFAETTLIFGAAVFFITAAIRRCIPRRRHQTSFLPVYEEEYRDYPKDTHRKLALVVVDADSQDEKNTSNYQRRQQPAAEDDAASTISEELGQFREVASMISELVSPRQSMDDSPPAYESQDECHDDSRSNGPRYTGGN